jgi:hypothetical protein
MLNRHEYIEVCKTIIDQYLGDSDYETSYSKRYLYCPYGCQGYSKNKQSHVEINYEGGFGYCYRCNEGGILYHLLKQCKNNNNTDYINNILNLYFKYYKYDSELKKSKATSIYKSYNFTIDNISPQTEISKLSNTQLNFLTKRLKTSDSNIINNIIKQFNFNTTLNENKLYYYSYHKKMVYGYNLLNNNGKFKFYNDKIINDKKDFYLLNNITATNLYISEGLFDLITINILDPLYNANSSSYMALCSRTYTYLYEFLLNVGKFYYENIYIILDNDINKNTFIKNIIFKLCNNSYNIKYKLYKNIYTIEAPNMYVDINDYYLNSDAPNMIINKIN